MPGMKRLATPQLKAADVPCPDCRAKALEPCLNGHGEMKGHHRSRAAWAKELQEKASQPDSTARWLRLRIRQGNPPTKPLPCGTEAAYRRHLLRGEEVDEQCREAARRAWSDRKQAVRKQQEAS